MSILYEDELVICDNHALTIKTYYFPAGSKRIPYASIRRIEEHSMGALSGKLRIWGMGLAPYWFHLDLRRPTKNKAIILDVGKSIKPVITPRDHTRVLDILMEKTQAS